MDVICLALAIPEMHGRREPVYILEDVILVPVFCFTHTKHTKSKEPSALKYVLTVILQIELSLVIERQHLNKCPSLDMTPILI